MHPSTAILSRFTSRPESIVGFILILAATVTVLATSDDSSNYRSVHSILYLTLLLAAFYDWKCMAIPNPIIAGGFLAGVFLIAGGHLELFESMAAVGSVLLLLFILRSCGTLFFNRPGFGMGDLKLFVVLAMFLGWNVFWVLYLSIMLAGVVAIIGLLMGVIGSKSYLPFAPCVLAALPVAFHLLPQEFLLGALLW